MSVDGPEFGLQQPKDALSSSHEDVVTALRNPREARSTSGLIKSHISDCTAKWEEEEVRDDGQHNLSTTHPHWRPRPRQFARFVSGRVAGGLSKGFLRMGRKTAAADQNSPSVTCSAPLLPEYQPETGNGETRVRFSARYKPHRGGGNKNKPKVMPPLQAAPVSSSVMHASVPATPSPRPQQTSYFSSPFQNSCISNDSRHRRSAAAERFEFEFSDDYEENLNKEATSSMDVVSPTLASSMDVLNASAIPGGQQDGRPRSVKLSSITRSWASVPMTSITVRLERDCSDFKDDCFDEGEDGDFWSGPDSRCPSPTSVSSPPPDWMLSWASGPTSRPLAPAALPPRLDPKIDEPRVPGPVTTNYLPGQAVDSLVLGWCAVSQRDELIQKLTPGAGIDGDNNVICRENVGLVSLFDWDGVLYLQVIRDNELVWQVPVQNDHDYYPLNGIHLKLRWIGCWGHCLTVCNDHKDGEVECCLLPIDLPPTVFTSSDEKSRLLIPSPAFEDELRAIMEPAAAGVAVSNSFDGSLDDETQELSAEEPPIRRYPPYSQHNAALNFMFALDAMMRRCQDMTAKDCHRKFFLAAEAYKT